MFYDQLRVACEGSAGDCQPLEHYSVKGLADWLASSGRPVHTLDTQLSSIRIDALVHFVLSHTVP